MQQLLQSLKIIAAGLAMSVAAAILTLILGMAWVETQLGDTMPLFTSEGLLVLFISAGICAAGLGATLIAAIWFPLSSGPPPPENPRSSEPSSQENKDSSVFKIQKS